MLKNIGIIFISICALPLMVIGLVGLSVYTLLYCLAKIILDWLADDERKTVNDSNNTPSHHGLPKLRVKHV